MIEDRKDRSDPHRTRQALNMKQNWYKKCLSLTFFMMFYSKFLRHIISN